MPVLAMGFLTKVRAKTTGIHTTLHFGGGLSHSQIIHILKNKENQGQIGSACIGDMLRATIVVRDAKSALELIKIIEDSGLVRPPLKQCQRRRL